VKMSQQRVVRSILLALAAAALATAVSGCGRSSGGAVVDARGGTAHAATVPAALAVTGTPVSLPRSAAGFLPPQVRAYADSLGPLTAVQYLLPGPSAGSMQTTVGGITVLVYQDAAAHDGLVQDHAARGALQSQQSAGVTPQQAQIGSHSSLYWSQVQVESGAAMGQPDRITSRYAFASSGSWVVQVDAQNVPRSVSDQFVSEVAS
jgi:hypothetical protein